MSGDGAGDRPSGLGDPDVLAACGADGGVVGVEEELRAVVDAVRHRGLEVGVGVYAEPVDGLDDGAVGAVHPVVPGVDVADGSAGESGASDGLADLTDVGDEVGGLSAVARLGGDAGGGETVEVLAADGETSNAAGEVGAVLLDGTLEGCDLVVDAFLAGGGPDAEEEGGV